MVFNSILRSGYVHSNMLKKPGWLYLFVRLKSHLSHHQKNVDDDFMHWMIFCAFRDAILESVVRFFVASGFYVTVA